MHDFLEFKNNYTYLPKEKLTKAILDELMIVDIEKGEMTWKKRGIEWFKDTGHLGAKRTCSGWNTKRVGKPAFYTVDNKGYLFGSILQEQYRTHQLLWFYTHGYSSEQIDHINGVRTDNRIKNLREVNSSQNRKNAAIHSKNTSGVSGVDWMKNKNKWRARITADGMNTHLGIFDTFEEAVESRKKAEKEYNFHPNHGRKRIS